MFFEIFITKIVPDLKQLDFFIFKLIINIQCISFGHNDKISI